MEQTEQVKEYQYSYAQINQYERKLEAGNIYTKECETINTRPRSANATVNEPNKIKIERKTKREGVRIWDTAEMIHD